MDPSASKHESFQIHEPNEEKATNEALKTYYNANEFKNTGIDSRFDIIDNEKLNNSLNSFQEKSENYTKEKERALIALNIIDKKADGDIDLAYDKETKLYHLIMGNSDKIKNGDLSEETLELVKAYPFKGVDINGLEEIAKLDIF